MGKFFTDSEKNRAQTYVLGFTSLSGKFGNVGHPVRNIGWSLRNSFETWIKKRYDYAFVDFKPFNQQHPGFSEPFFMTGRGHWATSRINYNTSNKYQSISLNSLFFPQFVLINIVFHYLLTQRAHIVYLQT